VIRKQHKDVALVPLNEIERNVNEGLLNGETNEWDSGTGGPHEDAFAELYGGDEFSKPARGGGRAASLASNGNRTTFISYNYPKSGHPPPPPPSDTALQSG